MSVSSQIVQQFTQKFFQPSVTNKELLVSESPISKKDVTIPRFELVSSHMGSNLVFNVLSALKTKNIRSVFGWGDSRVVLCWLNQSEVINHLFQIG